MLDVSKSSVGTAWWVCGWVSNRSPATCGQVKFHVGLIPHQMPVMAREAKGMRNHSTPSSPERSHIRVGR